MKNRHSTKLPNRRQARPPRARCLSILTAAYNMFSNMLVQGLPTQLYGLRGPPSGSRTPPEAPSPAGKKTGHPNLTEGGVKGPQGSQRPQDVPSCPYPEPPQTFFPFGMGMKPTAGTPPSKSDSCSSDGPHQGSKGAPDPPQRPPRVPAVPKD